MAQALQRGGGLTLKANPKLTFRKGAYTYMVETHGDQSTYRVTDGVRTLAVPIRWTFGLGGQTWVLEREGNFYQSLVSYYPSIGGLATTLGDEGLTPASIEEAIGRELTPRDSQACFGCHATNAIEAGKLNLDSLQPGVTCEHCHAGSTGHLIDAVGGNFDSTPPDLKKLSSEDVSSFCGQCHRTWEFVVENHWRGEINVRFQPYRLANSKCFSGTDPRISCVACHDPHRDLVRQESSYDGKCLACHARRTTPAPSAVKSCSVAEENCVTCHMPKVKLPGGLMTFSDHQIRIVRPGDAYPN